MDRSSIDPVPIPYIPGTNTGSIHDWWIVAQPGQLISCREVEQLTVLKIVRIHSRNFLAWDSVGNPGSSLHVMVAALHDRLDLWQDLDSRRATAHESDLLSRNIVGMIPSCGMHKMTFKVMKTRNIRPIPRIEDPYGGYQDISAIGTYLVYVSIIKVKRLEILTLPVMVSFSVT